MEDYIDENIKNYIDAQFQTFLENMEVHMKKELLEPLQQRISEIEERVSKLETTSTPIHSPPTTKGHTKRASHSMAELLNQNDDGYTRIQKSSPTEKNSNTLSPSRKITSTRSSSRSLGDKPARSSFSDKSPSSQVTKRKKTDGNYYSTRKRKTHSLREVRKPASLINRSSAEEMEKKLETIQGTLDKMEEKHKRNMGEIHEQEELEINFWKEVDRNRFNSEKFEEILSRGADINYVREGMHAIEFMIDNENAEGAKFVAERGCKFTPSAINIFTKAADAGNVFKINLFLECDFPLSKKDGGNSLLRCIRGKHLDAIEYFLSNQLCDLNVKDWVDGTPLMAAVKLENENLVKLLIKEKAQIDMQSRWGGTALTLAMQNNSKNIIPILIEAKADVNSKSKNGDTCINMAIQTNNQTLLERFIEEGANVNQADGKDQTPLDLCCKQDNTEFCQILINANADIDNQNPGGKTSLHVALENENMELVNILLDNCACVNISDGGENTALTLCAQNSHPSELSRILQAGCDVNHKNRIGFAALHYTCNALNFKDVKILLASDADINLNSVAWGSAVEIAEGKQNEELQNILDPPEERKKREREAARQAKLNVGSRLSSAAKKKLAADKKEREAKRKKINSRKRKSNKRR